MKLKLISQEGQEVEISQEAANLSNLIKMITECDEDETNISLPNIKFNVLQKIAIFLERCVINPPNKVQSPLKSTDLNDLIQEQYVKMFTDLNVQEMVDLFLAANYMDCIQLFDMMALKFSIFLAGQNIEQVAKEYALSDQIINCKQIQEYMGINKQ